MTPESKLVTIGKLIVEKIPTMTPEETHKLVELVAKQDILYTEMRKMLKKMDEQNNDMIISLQNKKDISEEEQILLQRLMAVDEEANPARIVSRGTLYKFYNLEEMIDKVQDEILSLLNA